MITNLAGLARELGFTRPYATKLTYRENFPYIKMPDSKSRQWRVDTEEVKAWLSNCAEERRHDMAERKRMRKLRAQFWQGASRLLCPMDVKAIRNSCRDESELRRAARRMRIKLDD